MRRLPVETTLLLDNTGIGRALFDLLQDDGWSPTGVGITAGIHVNVQDQARVTVPKSTLVAKLIALTQSGRLHVHADLKEWPVLRRELQNFRPEVTAAGNERWNAAPGSHDDLIIATALCSWYLQSAPIQGRQSYRLAALLAEEQMPEEFVVGVDVGQVSDPTAVCVMSRRPGVPDPATSKFLGPADPATAEPEPVGPAPDQVVEQFWRARPQGNASANDLHDLELAKQEAARQHKGITHELANRRIQQAGAREDHPLYQGRRPLEPVNGPLVRPSYAIGSLEYAEQHR